jgi:hypothetical protein
MEYDYTHLNHNSLVSQKKEKKKVVTKGMIIKGVCYSYMNSCPLPVLVGHTSEW